MTTLISRRRGALTLILPMLLAVLPGFVTAQAQTSDLNGASPGERTAIEALCGTVRGNIAHQMCLSNQLVGLARTARKPDLSEANPQQRAAIDHACAGKDIPAERFVCERAQLTAAGLPVRDEPGGSPLSGVVSAGPTALGGTRLPGNATPAAFPTFSLTDWRQERPPMPSTVSHASFSPAGLYEKISPSVYVVIASDQPIEMVERAGHSQGSAVAISDRILLTNCHVVAGRPQIKLTQLGKSGRATLAYADPAGDRCFLRSEDMALRPIPGVRPFLDLHVGETVFSLGTPTGLELSFNQGLVSGLRQNEGVHIIQNSAPSWHGSSGGGLFDAHGNLIGITTAAATAVPDTYFSIAADDFWP